MADRRDSQLPITTDLVGLYIPVLLPNGVSPTGYENYQIAIAEFQAGLQSQIDDNETDIIDHEARIQELEDGLTKVPLLAQSGAFTYSQPNDSFISGIYMRRSSGFTVPVSAVGYTNPAGVNGEEILSSRQMAISGGDYFRSTESVKDPYNQTGASRTIYFETTGTIDVIIILKTNLFT